MKTEWDYTNLAKAYLKRPSYSADAIESMIKITQLGSSHSVCDVGAGVAHLTMDLNKYFGSIKAVEPNDAMRELGANRTINLKNISWSEGTGEDTRMPSNTFDMVTFGSSFNVCNQSEALAETSRILKSKGWFACMWNHRILSDPIQSKIETIIKENIPNFDYGKRREDQTEVIKNSSHFSKIIKLEGDVTHSQSKADIVEAWSSHASLERQAGDKFESIINMISKYLDELNSSEIVFPYKTLIWLAQSN